jgi:hypothetical protein
MKTDRADGLYTTVVCTRSGEALGLVYSSKVSVIFFELKLIAESLGKAITKLGGKESLGPPFGGIILAQLVAKFAITTIRINLLKSKDVNFIAANLFVLIF